MAGIVRGSVGGACINNFTFIALPPQPPSTLFRFLGTLSRGLCMSRHILFLFCSVLHKRGTINLSPSLFFLFYFFFQNNSFFSPQANLIFQRSVLFLCSTVRYGTLTCPPFPCMNTTELRFFSTSKRLKLTCEHYTAKLRRTPIFFGGEEGSCVLPPSASLRSLDSADVQCCVPGHSCFS